MKIKFILSICFIILPFLSYAEHENVVDIVKKMVHNINIDNSRCITIPGAKGALRIYMESNKVSPMSIEFIVLNYNNKENSFQAGNNFLITQDDELVFGKYNDFVYVRVYNNPNKEHLTIKHNNVLYDYKKDTIKISADGNKFNAEEVLYNRNKKSFAIYKQNEYIKTIEIINQ